MFGTFRIWFQFEERKGVGPCDDRLGTNDTLEGALSNLRMLHLVLLKVTAIIQ